MEKEKLDEAIKTFLEDKDKFTKYMEDLNKKAEETTQEVQKLTNEKNEKLDNINLLQQKIQKKKSKMKQIDEKLVVFKYHKKFLDNLAIDSGRKIPKDKKDNTDRKMLEVKTDSNQKLNSRVSVKQTKEGMSNLFMTQVNQNGTRKQELEQRLEATDNIDEDSDYEIYFDKYSLLEELTHLEEDNLFKIHLVQEDEQTLENLQKTIDQKIQSKEGEIRDVRNNIELLIQSKNQLFHKQMFLDNTMKVKSHVNQPQSGKNALDLSRISNSKIGDMGEEKQTPFFMLQQLTGCSKEQINKLNNLISSILEKAMIKQDDQSDKLEMLRKMESKLDYYGEIRDYISKKKPIKLQQEENAIANKRKNDRNAKNKANDEIKLMQEKRIKEEKLKRKQDLMVFNGRQTRQRARKPDLKSKEQTDELPSEDIID